MSAGSGARSAATSVRRVQVAVLKLGSGKPFSQLPANPTRKAGKCKWLKRSGGFKGRKPRKRVCDSPVWITARGTRNWHVAFRGLPPGRYMLYSRAVDSTGTAEGNFSAKDKNRRAFRVR